MPEIVVISGKGGTGKTSLTAALAHLAGNDILCDLDVDAPDLHLLLAPQSLQTNEFWSGHIADINPQQCTRCGLCAEMCRFGAILADEDGQLRVDPLRCEGCKVCPTFCPEEAIAFNAKQCGQWYLSKTRNGPMVHAQLFPGEENSGRLVALLRKEAKKLAQVDGHHLILADGPPGIGCPVISALTGVDLAVIVTEPTPSGHHDLERIMDLCTHFQIPAAVIINKWDLNRTITLKIQDLCKEKNVPEIALLPHDLAFIQAMVQGKAITECEDSELAMLVKVAWNRITNLINMN